MDLFPSFAANRHEPHMFQVCSRAFESKACAENVLFAFVETHGVARLYDLVLNEENISRPFMWPKKEDVRAVIAMLSLSIVYKMTTAEFIDLLSRAEKAKKYTKDT